MRRQQETNAGLVHTINKSYANKSAKAGVISNPKFCACEGILDKLT